MALTFCKALIKFHQISSNFYKFLGVAPEAGDDRFEVRISEASADCLAKLEDFKQNWAVPPTMTRGAKKMPAPVAVPGDIEADPKKRARRAVITKDAKDKKKDDKAKVPADDDQEEVLTENDIRRNNAGNEAIRKLVSQIFDLEAQAFPDNPSFAADGACQIKDAGARQLTRDDLVGKSAVVFDLMPLGFDT